MKKTGVDLEFLAFFTESKLGKAGLTVTVDVYDESNNLTVNDASATEIAGGLYTYTLAGASVDAEGLWKAIFSTATATVDCQVIPAAWEVSNAIDDIHNLMTGPGATQYAIKIVDEVGAVENAQVWITSTNDADSTKIAGTFVTDSNGYVNGSSGVWLDTGNTVYIWVHASTASFTNPDTWVVATPASDHVITGVHTAGTTGPTLDNLRDMLRIRLNDVIEGNYTDTELDHCINGAYRDSQVLTNCHKVVSAISITATTHTYEIYPIYEALNIVIGTSNLERFSVEDMGVRDIWTDDANATPTMFMPITGGKIRLYPTPSANGTMTVTGYAVTGDMTADSDTPYALPAGFAATLILERAEAIARGLRPTSSNNVSIMQYKNQLWTAYCQTVVEVIKGGRK